MSDTYQGPSLEDLAHRIEQECGADTMEGQRLRLHLSAWADNLLADARSESASLRQRLADLGDQFNRERAARQALLHTALDLPCTVVLEIEQVYGKRVTPKRIDALIERLRPALEAEDYKLRTWGSRATMRLSYGRALAVMALQDSLDKLKGKVRRGP